MARIRTIKPEFWTSDQVMDVSRDARLLFIGIWNFADDHGRICLKPRTLKARILPADEDVTVADVERMVDELIQAGLILEYWYPSVPERYQRVPQAQRYGMITGWHHQRIDRPQPSKLPDPQVENGNSTIDRGPFDDRSSTERSGG